MSVHYGQPLPARHSIHAGACPAAVQPACFWAEASGAGRRLAWAPEPALAPGACAQLQVNQDNERAVITDPFGQATAYDLPSLAGPASRSLPLPFDEKHLRQHLFSLLRLTP